MEHKECGGMDLLKQHKVGRQNREITVEDVATQFLYLIIFFFEKTKKSKIIRKTQNISS
jgi:hypothetical protein